MENVTKMEQLYEGKAKKVYATNDPDLVIVDYKDDATAFNGEKKGTISGSESMIFASSFCTASASSGVIPLPGL